MNSILPQYRIERVRYELLKRDVTVISVERNGNGFARIVLSGEELAGFQSSSFDDHIKLLFEDEAGQDVGRHYTPRSWNAQSNELVLEFALHGAGVAAQWAEHVQPGERIAIGGPKGSMIIPAQQDWHLLVGDASSLPAICRRLEELPATSTVDVLLLRPEGLARWSLPQQERWTVCQLSEADALLDALHSWEVPAGHGFAWCAGEADLMRQVRSILLDEKKLPRVGIKVAAYWRQGLADFHERLS